MNPIKKFFNACMLILGLSMSNFSHAGMLVFDSANFVQAIQQVQAWAQQYAQMAVQLAVLEKTYTSISGKREMGSLVNHSASRQYLPAEYSTILSQGVGQWAQIRAMSQKLDIAKTGLSPQGDSAQAFQQAARQAAINRAVAESAYSTASQRFSNIQVLLDKINDSAEQKDIADLQARIQAEQVMMQNESNKLQMLQQLASAQRDLQTQQVTEIRMKSTKGGMPPGW